MTLGSHGGKNILHFVCYGNHHFAGIRLRGMG
jgi:hypothetical protein